MYGIDVVSISQNKNKKLWVKILKNIDFLACRDLETKDNFSFLPDNLSQKIHCFTDITFSLSDVSQTSDIIDDKTIIWCLANPFGHNEQQERYIDLINTFSEIINEHTDYKHVFIPFYKVSDTSFYKDIKKEVDKKVAFDLLEYDDFTRIRPLLKKAALCVCMRFHSLAFAIYENANFVTISYAPKMENLLKRVDDSDYVKYGVRESDNYHKVFDFDKQDLKKLIKERLISKKTCDATFLIKTASTGEELLLKWLTN